MLPPKKQMSMVCCNLQFIVWVDIRKWDYDYIKWRYVWLIWITVSRTEEFILTCYCIYIRNMQYDITYYAN